MATYQPPGWPSVIPRIVADDPQRLVAFIKDVFAATGEWHADRPAELRIGDSIVMVSGTAGRRPMPAFLYVYVPDADDVYRRALAAGTASLEPATDMPYGDRRAMIADVWGNTWQLATRNSPRLA